VGHYKRLMEERYARGDWDSLGKAICPDCLTDPALKELVARYLDQARCAYCGREREGVACDTDIVMTRINDGLAEDFTDPIEVLYYGEDGGWEGDTFDTQDLLAKIEEDIGADEFVADVIEAYGAKEWCDAEPYVTARHESLVYSWDRFADLVKYESRYLFLTRPGDEYPEPHEVGPGQMLDALGALVDEAGVIRELAAATDIFRARPGSPNEFPANAEELGTAPRDIAFSNRMSPAGIALFYGAFEQETAAREAWTGPEPGKEQVTIARFTNASPLRVLDLAELRPVPSRFDEARHLRTPLRFLHAFSERVSGAVRTAPRSVREFVNYVPTQIASEYFRTVYESEAGALDGILHRSAEHDGGTCCALFVPRERCVDRAAAHIDRALIFEDAAIWEALP
jgi:HEPN/RES N-terminal domain 1/RES domain